MLNRVLISEWIKVRKSLIWVPVLVGPALAIGTGLLDVSNNHELKPGTNLWEWMYPMLVSFYSLIFLPLLSGIFASLLCRFEHTAGGWKQLHCLPISRTFLYFAKLLYLIVFIGVTQVLLLAAILVVGFSRQIDDPIPWALLVKGIAGGWIASIPLAALQLSISAVWKSFAAPFAINAIFTIPTIAVINSETYGPYYPWAEPFNAMIPSGYGTFNMLPGAFYSVIVGGSLLIIGLGCWYFARRDVHS